MVLLFSRMTRAAVFPELRLLTMNYWNAVYPVIVDSHVPSYSSLQHQHTAKLAQFSFISLFCNYRRPFKTILRTFVDDRRFRWIEIRSSRV